MKLGILVFNVLLCDCCVISVIDKFIRIFACLNFQNMNYLTIKDYSLLEYCCEQWLFPHFCLIIPQNMEKKFVEKAIEKGNLRVVQTLHKQNILKNYAICNLAAHYGCLEILKWARANDFPWDEITCERASEQGNLDILKWLYENKCPWSETIFIIAAEQGHIHIIQWAVQMNFKMDKKICSGAAKNGYFDIVQFLRDKGCPWDENVYSFAVLWGRLDIIVWACTKKYLFNSSYFFSAINRGHLDIVHWMLINSIYKAENVHDYTFNHKIFPLLFKKKSYFYFNFFSPFMSLKNREKIHKSMLNIKKPLFHFTKQTLNVDIQNIVLNYL